MTEDDTRSSEELMEISSGNSQVKLNRVTGGRAESVIQCNFDVDSVPKSEI